MKKPTLPEAFLQRMQSQCQDSDLFFGSLNDSSPVSIRIHPKKFKVASAFEKVSWCSLGFYLEQRPSFTLDPLFHAGAYFVQEASSMFLEQFILQSGLHLQPVTALDLCASPGGKSTHLLSLLHEDSLLIANETIRSRLPALKENIVKWGFPNVLITQNDPSTFGRLTGTFDLIVCDAPCSGEGMFRKDPQSVSHWSLEQVRHCAERQKRLVQQAWKALKPGGIFIYSTCTFNQEENEEALLPLLSASEAACSLQLDVSGMGMVEEKRNPMFIYRFYPHRIKGEGFTIAALVKAGNQKPDKPSFLKKSPPLFHPLKQTPDWLHDTNGKFFKHGNKLVFLNDRITGFMEKEGTLLNTVYAGTEVAEIKGRDFIPLHEACMSILFKRNYFPETELELNLALKYLSGETNLQVDADEGFVLFTYQNIPLGFAKKTDHRFNNQYPKGWRIRKRLPAE